MRISANADFCECGFLPMRIPGMSARVEYFPLSVSRIVGGARMHVTLEVCAAAVVVVIGVLGLMPLSPGRRFVESSIDIHALFGLSLCALIACRCCFRLRHCKSIPSGKSPDLRRHLSRIVHLILYLVIGARLGLGMLASFWPDQMPGSLLTGAPFHDDPADHDYQLVLATGVGMLAMIRIATFGLRLRYEGAPQDGTKTD